MNEPQWTYQDIVNHFVKIIGNGTFTVETINESILLKMLDSKGIKIPVEKSYRDIDKDYKMHLQDIGITMNEPQLSAEMEIVTKFRQFLANWDYAHLTRKVSVEESRQMCDEFALTLATALEEQKQEILSEVEEMINTKYPLNRFADSYTGIMSRGKQMPTSVVPLSPDDEEAVSFLEFILNQLKGEK